MPKKKKVEAKYVDTLHILNHQIKKNVDYISFADQRSQGIITINAFLIPVIVSGLASTDYKIAAIIAITTGLLSIITAVISLYPRHYSHIDDSVSPDILHFTQLKNKTEKDYLSTINKLFKDKDLLYV